MHGTEKLIDSLSLTKSEKRALRGVVALGDREPNRFDRLLNRSLSGVQGFVALIVTIAVVVALFYSAWRLPNLLKNFKEMLDILVMPMLLLLLFFEQRGRTGLIFKLYLALENERASRRAGLPELPPET